VIKLSISTTVGLVDAVGVGAGARTTAGATAAGVVLVDAGVVPEVPDVLATLDFREFKISIN